MSVWRKFPLSRAGWTVVDQAVVSCGTFAVSVLLARALPAAEYGVYVLLFGGLLALQLCNATLLFYPLSVRMPLACAAEQPALFSATLVLATVLSASLGCVLAAVLLAFHRADLILPALFAFFTWQAQEIFRRGLMVTFQHRTAVWGDSVSYLGQAAIIGGLSLTGHQSIANALDAMALTSAVAALIQCLQLGWRLQLPHGLATIIADFWSIGGFWALGNGWLTMLRFQLLTWGLATVIGPAMAASLQATQNVVNLSNPIILGFGNIVPQAAAQASAGGPNAAWRIVCRYGALAVIPLACYTAIVLVAPFLILSTLYGAGSVYAGLGLALRLLIFTGFFSSMTEFVSWYLHGITRVPLALGINVAGTVTTAALAMPLIAAGGLEGACFALAAGNFVRLVAAWRVLLRLAAEACAIEGSHWARYSA